MLGTAPLAGAPIASGFGRQDDRFVELFDGFSGADALIASSRLVELLTEITAASDSAGLGRELLDEIEDGAQLADASDLIPAVFVVLAEAVGMASSSSSGIRVSRTADETMRFFEQLRLTNGFSVTVDEVASISDVLGCLLAVQVLERLRIRRTVVPNLLLQRATFDGLRLAVALRNTLPENVAEGVILQQLEDAQTALRVFERLRIAPTSREISIRNITAVEGVRLATRIMQFFGADLGDGVRGTVGMQTLLQGSTTVADMLTLEGAITPQLFIRAEAVDSALLRPEIVLKAIFSPAVVEGLEISAGQLMPDGGFTTWAMNTRTKAVTEYSDYAFNSFARSGNKYLGATEDGLYELLGNTDDGDDIVAHLRSGFMQFGGTRLSRLREVYIATRGAEQFVLKIVEADGREYIYQTTTRHMRTTKVHMGKGQRARYFAFELTSAGGDFDIDTLEFAPLVVNRRV